MSDERKLHVFEIGPDTVIAYDVDDAWTVWSEQSGEDRDDYETYDDPVLLPDDKTLSIWCDADGIAEPNGDGADTVERTCAEWIAREGRGFLCSTEY